MNKLQNIIKEMKVDLEIAIIKSREFSQRDDLIMESFFDGCQSALSKNISMLESLLNEQTDTITEDFHFRKHDVRQKKIKVIHGTFIEEPRCQICNADLTHEWLGGDYTLLMCDKKECWDKLNNRYERP